MIENIGFMQGRLSPLYDGKIQCFPKLHWEKEFKLAKSINLKKMEWTLDDEDLFENPLLTFNGQRKIKELCDIYKISISSVTGDCFMQKPFWKEKNKKTKLILNDKFELICNACKNLRIKYIVVPIVDNGKLENEKQKEDLIEYLIFKKDLLKSTGVFILFESDLSPKKLYKFIEEFPKDTFGINFDTGNSASLGFDSDDEFQLYGERIKNVHIKDRLLGGNTVPLGQGNTDFEKIFKNLFSINYKGNLILQTARSMNNKHSDVLNQYRLMIEKWIKRY